MPTHDLQVTTILLDEGDPAFVLAEKRTYDITTSCISHLTSRTSHFRIPYPVFTRAQDEPQNMSPPHRRPNVRTTLAANSLGVTSDPEFPDPAKL